MAIIYLEIQIFHYLAMLLSNSLRRSLENYGIEYAQKICKHLVKTSFFSLIVKGEKTL